MGGEEEAAKESWSSCIYSFDQWCANGGEVTERRRTLAGSPGSTRCGRGLTSGAPPGPRWEFAEYGRGGTAGGPRFIVK